MKLQDILSIRFLPYIITVTLFIIPFFWLKPGQIDIGGDSSRLYFYDPQAFLKNVAWYGVSSQGTRIVEPNYFYIPFVYTLYLIKSIINSSYLLISILNSLKLSLGFLGAFFITRELLNSYPKKSEKIKILASVVSGLFYLFSSRIIDTWDKALLSHNQIFLNPIVFFLLLKYVLTSNKKYAIIFLFVSFIFSPAFSLTSAPPIFAFYPLAIVFIFIYTKFITKVKIPYKGILLILTSFILLQTFHLLPQLVSLFRPGSFANARVFDKESIANEGIRYFISVLSYAKTSINILLPSLIKQLSLLSFVFPLVVLLGFIFLKKEKKTFLLIGIFFLLTLFLLSANITSIGRNIYQMFFYIPGFSMFRNFIGQWIFVYTFYYSLLLGLSAYLIFDKLTLNKAKILFYILFIFIIIQGFPLINGSLIQKIHPTSKNVTIPILMDKEYQNVLRYADSLPKNGKILTLPFTDSYYQVLAGKKGGAYVGPSSLSLLTTATDFVGYQVMPSSITEELLRQSRTKNYQKIKEILRMLNINYIFHNEDTRIYDDTFPISPYSYVRQSLPSTQKEYSQFIKKIGGVKIYKKGPYIFYRLQKNKQQDLLFIARDLKVYEDKIASQPGIPFIDQKITKNNIFLTSDACKQIKCLKINYKNNLNFVSVTEVNPTKYYLKITANSPFVLSFLDAFDNSWKLYIKNDRSGVNWFETLGQKSLAKKNHIQINSYANGWAIKGSDLEKIKGHVLILEMTDQKIFYLSMIISILTFIALIVYTIKIYIINKLIAIMRKKNG